MNVGHDVGHVVMGGLLLEVVQKFFQNWRYQKLGL